MELTNNFQMMYKFLSRMMPSFLKKKVNLFLIKILLRYPTFIDKVYVVLGRDRIFEILRGMKLDKFCSKKFKTYELLKEEDLLQFRKVVLDDEKFEDVALESVFGLSKGGKYSVYFDQLAVYEFRSAAIHTSSDFIRLGDRVYWDKSSKVQLPMVIPGDSDLIAYDETKVILKNKNPDIMIGCGFSLLGMKPNSWGHFVSMLPKFEALKYINEPDLEIILPASVDLHIKEVAEALVLKYRSAKIRYVEDHSIISFEKLYYCSSPNFLADHAYIEHPALAVIRNFSKKIIFEYGTFLSKDVEVAKKRKIFIARDGSRNLSNYLEVELYFESLGFEIIRPHQLTLLDKMKIFSEATHIVGPGSSGFANMIFCKPGAKALILQNFARTLDLYFDLFSDEKYFNIKTTIMIGIDVVPGAPHSEFYIPIDRIHECIQKTNFLI